MIVVFLEAVRMAVLELWRNKVRTALTSLGILIGVGAVIAMVGLGQGATASIEDDLASMGSNLLFVEAGTGRGPHAAMAAAPLQLADATAIEQRVRHVKAVAPVVSTSGTAVAGGVSWKTSVTGSTAGWFVAMDRGAVDGRAFTPSEGRGGAAVCVVGETVRSELFGGRRGIGEEIRLDSTTCRVIGVLEPLGENTFGMDQDDLIVMPIATVQRRLVGSANASMIFISADSTDAMAGVGRDVDVLMRERRHVTGDSTVDFTVRDTRELASMVGGVTTILTAFLAAVAGVSLVVGGIGIMNIMLVSVTERTREIGVRMAIGALGSDVMTQFLVEAVVLSVFGGVMGVALGITVTVVGANLIGIPVVISPTIVAIAVGFSGLMGVGFGYWPARRAARLEPIDALRHT